MTTDDDYQAGDEFDWDRDAPEQYCHHGTFIGSWWGPDVLCGFCEDGVTDEEYAMILETRRLQAVRDRARGELIDALIQVLRTFTRIKPQDLTSEYIDYWFGELKVARIEDLERYLEAA
jgi:hypothetical protein